MIPMFDRRALMLGAGASVLASGAALAQPKNSAPPIPTWKTEVKQLAPNVYAFIRGGGPGVASGGLSNAGILVGPNNITLVDSMGPPLHAHELKRAVEKISSKPVTRVINTHFHRDHTNGNFLFEPAEIVMTPSMAAQVLEDGIPKNPWANRPAFLPGIEELRLAQPTTLIEGPVTYRLGDLEARAFSPGAGHTFGDLMVYLPKQKILFTGDIAFFNVMPAMHTSDPTHWLTICDQIQKMDVDVIVPGHGPVGGKKDLADMAELMRLMIRELRKGYDKGLTPGQAAAAADVGRFGGWEDQERLAWAAPRLYVLWKTGKVAPQADNAAQEKAIAEFYAIRGR